MHARALIVGLAGPRLGADERAFLREAEPWGLILFTRNISTPDQVRALVGDFRETLGRITDCAYQFRLDIGASANKIDHFLCNRIIKHSVDREIAAFCILFR